MIEVVVVDLGGVAARFTPERRLVALSELSGLSEGEVQARIFGSGLEARAEQGDLTLVETVSAVKDALSGSISTDALVHAWSLAFDVDGEVMDLLEHLEVRKALFTNNGPMLDACLDGPLRELRDAFDHLICSWHLRARKPDALAFERAADLLGVEPARLLLLDDTAANVEVARRCGWQAEVTAGDDITSLRALYRKLANRYRQGHGRWRSG